MVAPPKVALPSLLVAAASTGWSVSPLTVVPLECTRRTVRNCAVGASVGGHVAPASRITE
jgi:NaMN:DMB phosphoribosyltransferase